MNVEIHLRGCRLNAAQDEAITNLIANGELRGAIDVSELESVLRVAGTERGCFVLDAAGRSAEIASDPHARIEWDRLEWSHEPPA